MLPLCLLGRLAFKIPHIYRAWAGPLVEVAIVNHSESLIPVRDEDWFSKLNVCSTNGEGSEEGVQYSSSGIV